MESINNCKEKTDKLLYGIKSVMNSFGKKMSEVCEKELPVPNSYENTKHVVESSIDEALNIPSSLTTPKCNNLSEKLGSTKTFVKKCTTIPESRSNEEELWSMDSRPVTFATSQEVNDCDFQFVETFLPKALEQGLTQKLKDCDDDELSESSHAVFTIAKLVSKLNNQINVNKKLQEHIKCLENELDVTNMKLDLQEFESNNNCGKLTALVDEVYNAQREREAAVLARLKLANNERNEALLKSKAFLNSKDKRFPRESQFSSHVNLRELLESLCHATTARAAESHGRAIMKILTEMKLQQSRMTHEEMTTVITQRNTAMRKIDEASSSSLHRQSDSSQHNKLLSKRLATTEEEMEVLRVHYSLVKSLQDVDASYDDAQRLVEALRITDDHLQIQEANNNRNKQEIEMLLIKNEKLERLVEVLRKKLITHSSKPS